MIQHDMMMFDHGMPRRDGTMSDQQRPEADVNIEFQCASKFADAGAGAGVGNSSRPTKNTPPIIRRRSVPHDQHGFDAVSGLAAAISLREN